MSFAKYSNLDQSLFSRLIRCDFRSSTKELVSDPIHYGGDSTNQIIALPDGIAPKKKIEVISFK